MGYHIQHYFTFEQKKNYFSLLTPLKQEIFYVNLLCKYRNE